MTRFLSKKEVLVFHERKRQKVKLKTIDHLTSGYCPKERKTPQKAIFEMIIKKRKE
jgi:hypothetical protein